MGIIAGFTSKVAEKGAKECAKRVFGLIQGWKWYYTHEVVVGITEESNVTRGGEDEEGGISNSALLYLHENGIPSHNIPPRPVLIPALTDEATAEKIEKLMKDAAQHALLFGDKETAEKDFEKAGMVGRDACKNWITDGGHLAPNAPSTVARKGSSLPLVDTGSMLNSITYAVRKK